MARKTFSTYIIYPCFIFAGLMISAYLSLLGISAIPFGNYSVKAFFVAVIFIFLTNLAVIESNRRLSNDILNEEVPIFDIRRVVIGAVVELLILIILFLIFRGTFSYVYHLYSFNTNSSVKDGDDTCLSILEAIDYDNNNSQYLYAAGKTYYAAGEYTKAISYLQEALKHDDPSYDVSFQTHLLLGKSYLSGYPHDEAPFDATVNLSYSDLIEASKHLRIALTESLDNSECNFLLGITSYYKYQIVHSNESAFSEALNFFDSAVENSPSSSEYYYWRGCLKLENNPGEAKIDFEKAIGIRYYWAPYHFALGRASFAMENFEDAANSFNFAAGLDPSCSDYKTYYNLTLEQLGKLSWGDSIGRRPGYTQNEISAGALGSDVTLNSLCDSIDIGDERSFIAAQASEGQIDSWNTSSIEIQDGKIYTIRLFVHNNNPETTAEGVTANFYLPKTVATSHTIAGYLDCPNAVPERCWDTITLCSDDLFFIEYVNGSARYTNNLGTTAISDEDITSGVMLGYDRLNGIIPGGYDYSGYLTIDVRAYKCVAAKTKISVRLKGTKEWGETISVEVGDEVEFQIEFMNYLSQKSTVVMRNIFSSNIKYVEGSAVLYNSNHPDGIFLNSVDEEIMTNGINIGEYSSWQTAYVRFTGIVVDNSLLEGTNYPEILVHVTLCPENGEQYICKKTASVMVKK